MGTGSLAGSVKQTFVLICTYFGGFSKMAQLRNNLADSCSLFPSATGLSPLRGNASREHSKAWLKSDGTNTHKEARAGTGYAIISCSSQEENQASMGRR